ncbi:hypothetical protein PI125_g7847 [Phytophthora idaei]|nr:hypothetical protein PI125_g7847 [Phytophthora idaei]
MDRATLVLLVGCVFAVVVVLLKTEAALVGISHSDCCPATGVCCASLTWLWCNHSIVKASCCRRGVALVAPRLRC